MPAIVDLKDAVAVAAVADDVAPGVAARAARLLGGDGRKQARLEMVAGRRGYDLRAVGDGQLSVHAPLHHCERSR